MKRFTGHKEPWGDFVDVKINAPDLLGKEIKKKRTGTVSLSGVCDPYQPLEAKYKLTRRCLEILAREGWPVAIQTRSGLVTRDIDILKKSKDIEAGFSITTANDEIRKIFEPNAPSVEKRLKAIETLHQNGIRTYAIIAPILPDAENLIRMLAGSVDYIIIDRMNYFHASRIYEKHGWKDKNTYEYFRAVGSRIAKDCAERGIECRSVY